MRMSDRSIATGSQTNGTPDRGVEIGVIATFLAAAIAASPVHAKLVLPRAGVVGGQPAAATVVVTGRTAAPPRVTFAALTETVAAAGRRTRAWRYSVRFRLPI